MECQQKTMGGYKFHIWSPSHGHCSKLTHFRKEALGVTSRLQSSVVKASVNDNKILLERLKAADEDKDGKLTFDEVHKIFQEFDARKVNVAPPKPVAWDLALYKSISESKDGVFKGLVSHIQARLEAGKKTPLSHILFSVAGAFVSTYLLGLISDIRKDLPFVGEWHQQGLGLLVGSLGTVSILLFARPESEPVRIWNFIAGHVLPVFLGSVILHSGLPINLARALALAAGLGVMMITDCIHPPGGALILLLADSPICQKMDSW
eukprot:CAMPEP_0175042860 /NCGR_PEP_ID=MMETSP0052_2-20121109/2825_1 /TAXON_ID=51329 ORGANISM="Polytomella parva, Strain SAG 63-3" /NCGR_SAMPLE_ID=MMETSP0052_2 /ASSEMBLY_ACC=CAM_ASM_000194 /LENGTH=263 /DNA_ID=CAMNT_0016305773 /DNA_START=207 /DNA_END=995 /DNA_ORIENTATION=+